MNEAEEHAEPFVSLEQLERHHDELLERVDAEYEAHDALGVVEVESAVVKELHFQIVLFLERSAATGKLVDDLSDRTRVRALHDYWFNVLVRAGLHPPRIRIAAFDPRQLPDLPDDACPYVGLEAFREKTARFFFGREDDTARLVTRIAREPLVIVRGASGSGKSSLVFGGVLPALRRNADDRRLTAEPFTPGRDPFGRLLGAFSNVVPVPTVGGFLGRFKMVCHRAAKHELGVLLVIDQFEEVFTLIEDHFRKAFGDALAIFLDANEHNRILLTLREEFRPMMARFHSLGERMTRPGTDFSLRPLGHAELRRAIVDPGRLVNLEIEDEVVEDLINEVLGQPAALPLLQFTLRELWARRFHNRINREVLDRVGGPLEALRRAADRFYEGQIHQTQKEIRRVLLELVHVGHLLETYRKPVRLTHLREAGRANTDEVVDVLARHDFVRMTTEPGSEDAVVEIKHEALIRNWPRFVGWIEEKRERHRRHLMLSDAARRWDDAGRPSSGLYQDWQLAEAKRLEGLSALEEAFIAASVSDEERTREVLERRAREAEELATEARMIARRRTISFVIAAVVGVLALSATIFITARLTSYGEERDEAQAQLEELSAKLASSKAERRALSDELNRLEEKSKQLSTRETELQSTLSQLSSDRRELKETIRESVLVGFAVAAKGGLEELGLVIRPAHEAQNYFVEELVGSLKGRAVDTSSVPLQTGEAPPSTEIRGCSRDDDAARTLQRLLWNFMKVESRRLRSTSTPCGPLELWLASHAFTAWIQAETDGTLDSARREANTQRERLPEIWEVLVFERDGSYTTMIGPIPSEEVLEAELEISRDRLPLGGWIRRIDEFCPLRERDEGDPSLVHCQPARCAKGAFFNPTKAPDFRLSPEDTQKRSQRCVDSKKGYFDPARVRLSPKGTHWWWTLSDGLECACERGE